MEGKTVVITGSTGGIGFYSAQEIARLGARVIIVGRDEARADAAVDKLKQETGNAMIERIVGDVSTLQGVQDLATTIGQRAPQIDVLINNSGYMGNTLVHNADGIEMHFAVNVVAPWKLTLALLSNLKAAPGARVLNITGGDKPAAVDPSNLQAEKKFRGLMTYTHSKSVLEAMSVILSKKLEPEGVTVNIAFPGRASTAMTQSLTSEGLPGPMKIMMPFFKLLFKNDGGKSALGASKSTVFAAVDPSLNGVTGRYYDTNCKEQKLHKTAYDESVHQKILEALEKY